MQLGQLQGRKLRLTSRNLAAEIPCLARQPFGACKESLRLTQGLLALLEPLLQTQKGSGIFEQSAATLPARREPSGIESTDLASPQLVLDDLLGQPLAGFTVNPGQRYQGFHRRLGRDLAATDRLLDRQRKLAHQAQKSADPGGALEEALAQLVLAPAKAMLELGQQPPLLQSRRARTVRHLPPQDQRLGLPHLPHQRLHCVVAQAAKSRDALMAVNDHIAAWCLVLRNHHDRLLLAVLFQALPQPTLPLTTVSAQRGVRHLQLVPLQVHDGSSCKTHGSLLGLGPSLKPSRRALIGGSAVRLCHAWAGTARRTRSNARL